MSNVGQGVVAVVGTVVGSYFGNPQLGFQLGMLVGEQIFPTQLPGVHGPRMRDNRTTNAQIGGVVFEVFGVDVVPGTVIWMGPVIEIAKTTEVGGKGGGSEQKQTTYSYQQSIALGLCRGPKAGVLRIWENGLLVFDSRDQQEDESDADYEKRYQKTAEYRETFELYFGGSTQLPDPTIEMHRGAGNVPAYRGLMYMVYPHRNLLDTQGLRHPNFKVEISENRVLTSWPYPVEVLDALDTAFSMRQAPTIVETEAMDVSFTIIPGTLRAVLVTYNNYPPERLDATASLQSGTIRTALITYSNYPPERLDATASVQAGTIRVALITYGNYPTERIDATAQLVSGTLT